MTTRGGDSRAVSFLYRKLNYYIVQLLNSQGMREEIIEPNIKYSKIGENRRTKLIDLVVQQGFKIRRASKMLKINESTAKSILKLYRQTGNMTVRPMPQKTAFISKNHSENPREIESKSRTLLSIQNQEKPPTLPPTQLFAPQLFYCYSEPCFPTFYMILPPSIL